MMKCNNPLKCWAFRSRISLRIHPGYGSTFVVPLFLALFVFAPVVVMASDGSSHEVWMLDQSNTHDSDGNGSLDSGGTLYIFDGRKLAGRDVSHADPEVINLGGALADWVIRVTATAPVRPHYITFNKSHTRAIIAFVASGHVLIIEAATRKPVFVVDVGTQAHAAVPSPDESYILVSNQNGKRLQHIDTDYAIDKFVLGDAATLDLATGTTPSGAPREFGSANDVGVRPDNAPILALPDSTSNLAFVTLRGGGMFVVDNARHADGDCRRVHERYHRTRRSAGGPEG